MPPLLLLLPPLLLALVVLLVLRRRRSGDATGTPAAARDSEEVRLLRLQVETLTDALHEVNTRNTAALAAPSAPVVAPVPPVEPVESVEPAPAAPAAEPTLAPVAPVTAPDTAQETVAAPDALSGPLLGPLPDLPTPPPADRTARAYADLSRTLAGTGRTREAVLAQWAADVRVLAPLLGGRGDALCDALGRIDPADPAATLLRARAAASALVGPSFALSALLADVSHLSGPVPAGRAAAQRGDVSADVLPDHLVRALESVLVGSAALAGDHRGVSVGLRCDLLAHVVADEAPADVEARVRDILEPHERDRFDTALAGRAS